MLVQDNRDYFEEDGKQTETDVEFHFLFIDAVAFLGGRGCFAMVGSIEGYFSLGILNILAFVYHL